MEKYRCIFSQTKEENISFVNGFSLLLEARGSLEAQRALIGMLVRTVD